MEMILDSGARLQITLSDFDVCDRLLIAVSKELEGVGLNLGLKSGGLGDILNMDIDKDQALNTLKNAILRLSSSTLVRPILWECMGRVVYNGEKVTPKTFEPIEARGDWPIVAKEVLVNNLLPFFPKASSLFTALGKAVTKDQGTK
jgi:hypothetical protein